MSAVSNNVTPQSRAALTTVPLSDSEHLQPKLLQPSPISETVSGKPPSWRYSKTFPFCEHRKIWLPAGTRAGDQFAGAQRSLELGPYTDCAISPKSMKMQGSLPITSDSCPGGIRTTSPGPSSPSVPSSIQTRIRPD